MAEKRKDSKGRNLRTGESQRKDGRYAYRWQENGKTKTVYSMDLGDLREKEKQIQKDIEDGINVKSAEKIKLNDMFETWIKSRSDLNQSTQVRIESEYRVRIKEKMGEKKISEIKYSDIFNFYRFLSEERNYSKSSIAQVHSVMYSLFDYALKDEIVRKNPCIGVWGDFSRKFLKEKSAKRHSLTPQEQKDFFNYIENSGMFSKWLNIFIVFFETGARFGEIAGLRWEDCDFDKEIISINHSMNYMRYKEEDKATYHIVKTKTLLSVRDIPMSSNVKIALLREKEQQEKHKIEQPIIDGYTNFCFLNRDGRPHVDSNFNKIIKRILSRYNKQEQERAKKENREPKLIRHFSAHNMRHTFASNLVSSDANIKAVQELMGHSNFSTTMDIYSESNLEIKRAAIKKIEHE